MRPGAAIGLCLFAAATAWNAGNIGPAATSIGDDLDVSLAAIGVLGGSVLVAGLVGAKLGSARLTRAVGAAAAARLSCGMALAGNVVIAVSPWFAGVGVGRLTTGFSLELALVLGPVLARRAGGVRMVGLFGGAVTLGTAAGLGVLGLPYVLGIWGVPFLTEDIGLSAGFAGALGVLLDAISAVMRPEGSRLEAEGASLGLLGGVAPLLAGAGLVVLALGDAPAIAVAGVLLAGAGFAIPYAAMYDEASRLFPQARVAAVGLFSVGGKVETSCRLPSRRRLAPRSRPATEISRSCCSLGSRCSRVSQT